jgi:hypothetical protein
VRKRITYANVAATLALVFAMSGGALAAKHYVITSTKQINPKVLRALKGKTGATGATGANGTPGPQGKEGKEGKEGPPATALWARVGPDGTLRKGRGAVSSKELGKGEYEVVFDRNVSACAYEATVGSASVSPENTEFDGKGAGGIRVAPRFLATNAVSVVTSSPAGTAAENAFHLAVFC